MTRVTESLDFFKTEWYVEWLLKVGKRQAGLVSKKALKIGTRLHELIARDETPNSKDTIEVRNCHKAFLAWKERYGVGTLRLLERKTDELIGLTGEADALWVETETLLDWKTSARITPNNFFQLGGYKRLGYQCKSLGIVRLDKQLGTFEYKTNTDLGLSLEQCVDAFESAFKHYQYYRHLEAKLGDNNA